MRSISGHSVEALDMFIIQIETQFLDSARSGLDGSFIGNRLSCFYTLTHIFGFDAISVHGQGPTRRNGGDSGAVNTNLPMPALPRPSKTPDKESLGDFREAGR